MLQMKNKVIGQCEERIKEQDLLELEQEYHFQFPEDIRQFYMEYNGGRLEKNYYINFYSIKHGLGTLNEKMRLNYVDDWWPKEMIPFGHDGGGNSYCFHVRSGQIYYIYEDTDDDDGNVPVEYLAPDFLSFVNGMAEAE